MMRSVKQSLLLLLFSVVLLCGIYPQILWGIGHAFFRFQVNGSILSGPDGKPVGSLLIAQPFTRPEYFYPRPSAASFDATASSSSALAVSNYALRDRVARLIGPLATYATGAHAGQPVAPDIEAWFDADRFQGKPGIVAQWADAHNGLAQAWVSADPTHADYINAWAKAHPQIVRQFIHDNPGIPKPAAGDLAVVFFEHFSADYPGRFPSAVTHTGADGKTVTAIEPVAAGGDIQSIFFDTWRTDHPDVALQPIPGDYVTTSGSGLDPDITLENAEFQLDRIATQWAHDLKRDPGQVKAEIQSMLHAHAFSPGDGLFGGQLVNVLEMNLALRQRYGAPS